MKGRSEVYRAGDPARKGVRDGKGAERTGHGCHQLLEGTSTVRVRFASRSFGGVRATGAWGRYRLLVNVIWLGCHFEEEQSLHVSHFRYFAVI